MSQSEQQLPLASFYAGWEIYQQRLVTAIEPLSAEQLALSPAADQWSVGMLARHIVASRVRWFHQRMGKGSAALAHLASWDEEGERLHSADEIREGLEASWQMIQGALADWTSADLGRTFPHPARADWPVRSLQWIIWHVLEHDIHHGGELSSILGAHGLAAVDLD